MASTNPASMAKGGMLRLFDRAPEPAHLDVAHNGEVYRVALSRSARSRRFTLRIRAASRDVLLTMPARALAQGGAGIRRAPFRLDRRAARPAAASRRFRAVGQDAAARRRPHIVHRPGARGVVWLETCESGPLICVAGEQPHVARRVADFLKREALQGPRGGGRPPRQGDGGPAEANRRARHGEPLGLVLLDRSASASPGV